MFGHDHRRLHHRPLTPVSTVNLAAAVTLSIAASADLGYNPEALSAAPILSVSKSLADLALNDQEVSLRAETSLTIAAAAALAADISLAAAPSTSIAASAVLAADISLAAAPQLFINRQLAWLNLDNALAATPQIQMQAVVNPNPVALAATPLVQFTVTVDPNAVALNATPLVRISRQTARLSASPMVFAAAPIMRINAACAGSPNTRPTISDIARQGALYGVGITVPFTIGDAETPAAQLTLVGTSSNQSLVPDAGITFGGSGANRTVTIMPTAATSTCIVTIKVLDAEGASASTEIVVDCNTQLLLSITFAPDGGVIMDFPYYQAVVVTDETETEGGILNAIQQMDPPGPGSWQDDSGPSSGASPLTVTVYAVMEPPYLYRLKAKLTKPGYLDSDWAHSEPFSQPYSPP